MALTNAQYDEIRRNYDAIQLHNQNTQQKRLEKAFAENPRLQEIEGSIASISDESAYSCDGIFWITFLASS